MSGTKRRKTDLPVALIKCTGCGKEANANSREVDGWTLAPSDKVQCTACNGADNDTYIYIPAKEKGKYIRQMYGG